MPQSAARPILPTCKQSHEDKGALHTTAPLVTPSLEDLRLAELIEHALHATGYSMLRDIKVFVNARIVHLVGRAPSYYMKQIAQVTALAVPGTLAIHNEVDVVPLT